MDSEDSSDDQRNDGRTPADMVSSFILNAPPGEINEVLGFVKGIVKNDTLIDEQVSKVLPKYIKAQLTPVIVDGCEYPVILSNFNDIGGGRFVDPRMKCSFSYDYVDGSVSNIQPWQHDANAESWRLPVEQGLTDYSSEHYHQGASSVFSSYKESILTINACLEDLQFQPKKFWNGRWRSIWTLSFNPSQDKQAELKGLIRLHVHYYEDGNVQMISSKHCDRAINVTKPEQMAKELVEAINKFEDEYQRAISENYQTMSDTTFKALRRPLPVIRSKIEWNKLKSYKIGSELRQQ